MRSQHQLLTQPFMTTPASYADLSLAMTSDRPEPESFNLSDYDNVRSPYHVDANGVAHISVYSTLLNNPDPWIKRWISITDYKDVQAEITQANSEARGIMYHIDSPGGSVAGCRETGELIAQSHLPSVVYSDEICCSAGYYLASGANLIMSSPSAIMGNIGTILKYTDLSQYYANMGVERKAITNDGADYKSTFALNSLTERQEQFLQEDIDRMGQQFQSHILDTRPAIISRADEVFKAGWYSGESAYDLGLIDYIGTSTDAYDTLLGML